jgi:predicted kinase
MTPVIILRGLPGSGKSTYCAKLKAQHGKIRVCSADAFFETPKGYWFEISKLQEAHAQCMRWFLQYLDDLGDSSPIVVDNTNTTAAEVSPYVSVARSHGIEPRIISLRVPVSVCLERQIHRVPRTALMRLEGQLDESLPRWFPEQEWIEPPRTDLDPEPDSYE